MLYVTLAVGLATLLNLVLTYGVIRRLREHGELLSERAGVPMPIAILQAGERPGDGADVTGIRLVAFFSPQCGPCKEMVPEFARYAAGVADGPASILAVITEDGPEASQMATPLLGSAVVRFEPPGGPLAKAFRVKGFPAWCVLDEHGVVQHSGTGIDTLPSAVTV